MFCLAKLIRRQAIMGNPQQTRAICHYVPPHILRHIAQSQAAPEEARQVANRTLSADTAIRDSRIQALASGKAPTAPDDSISAAQAPIRVAFVGPAAVDAPHDVAAPPLVLRRAIFDAKNSPDLPGDPARAEGAARTTDRQINNVYDGVGITVKFFHTVFSRNAINGKGVTPIVTVHYNPEPKAGGYDNAFWNGTQFAFGDGDGVLFDYFTDSLDVVAHELTHAVTQFTAGIGFTKQAGGLNESISDVFAAMAEQWFFGQTAANADWLTGQNIFAISVRGAALRNIAHPGTAFNDPVLGKDSQIAHFSQYDDKLDVHQSSGIPNRAFYLVATGLGGFSFDQAGSIWFATLTDPRVKQVGENITFEQWADVTVDQANKLLGARASTIVRNAWVSVGVLV
jgi:Zn-dependent metalloprotease